MSGKEPIKDHVTIYDNGYHWWCPKCDKKNTGNMKDLTEEVTCEFCEESFRASMREE